MYEAYSVAVKLTLINQVSAGLGMISKQFGVTSAEATVLQSKLNSIKLMGLTGAAMAGAGFMGLGLISKVIKPASEYVHQLNIMNMQGLKQKEIAEAIGDAWKNTSTVITTNATGNLRTMLDLRNLLGTMEHAQMALPIVTKMQAVFESSTSKSIAGNAGDFAYSMVKALDVIGAATNLPELTRQASMMSKAIMATQGRVTPAAMQSAFQYARQARYGWNDEFKYEILPAFIQEYAGGKGGSGGGSRGVGPMFAAMYRMTNQGYINKKSMAELVSLGLVSSGSALKTTTSGTTVGPMKNWQEASSNPFLWVQNTLVPAIKAKYGQNLTKEELIQHINMITRGNQLAGAAMLEMAVKAINFTREQTNIRRTMSYEDAYKSSVKNDPDLAWRAVHEQWKNVKTAIGAAIVPTLIPFLMNVAVGFNSIANIIKEYPHITGTIVFAFGALSGAMAFSGTIWTLYAGFKALQLVLGVSGISTSLIGMLMGPAGLAVAAGIAMWGIYKLVKYLLHVNDSPEQQKQNNPTGTSGGYSQLDFGSAAAGYKSPNYGKSGGAGDVHVHNTVDERGLTTIVMRGIEKALLGPQKAVSSVDMNRHAIPAGY